MLILVGVALWWFGSLTSYISFNQEVISVQKLIFFPVIYLIVFVFSFLITVGLVGASSIGWFMDIQSPQTDTAADVHRPNTSHLLQIQETKLSLNLAQ